MLNQNQEIVNNFLNHYKNHDFKGMESCLGENCKFSDFAFDNLEGYKVVKMWHWFCVRYPPREEPIDVPDYKITECHDDWVTAEYEVSYHYGEKQRPVNYVIKSRFQIQDGKIVQQQDSFGNVSQFEFAKMALGYPLCLLAFTPLLQTIVRKKANDKLNQFIKDYP